MPVTPGGGGGIQSTDKVSSERAGRRGRREMTCARRCLPFAIATAMASPLREVLLVGLGGVGAICEKPLNKSSVIIN